MKSFAPFLLLHFVSRVPHALMCVLFLLFLVSGPIAAQVDTGAIVGQITDNTGATIPGAKVTVVEENTGIKQTVSAGTNGSYTISPLKLGMYSVSAEQNGFKTSVRSHVDVTIQSRLEVSFQLEVGAVSESVQVNSSSPVLETQSSSIQQLVEARAINDLPLNGRNPSFLAQLSLESPLRRTIAATCRPAAPSLPMVQSAPRTTISLTGWTTMLRSATSSTRASTSFCRHRMLSASSPFRPVTTPPSSATLQAPF